MYSNKVLKHFRNPKNYGKIVNPDGVGKVGNIVCGDVMWLYIKVGKNNQKQEVINKIKFETFGCVAAIATSNMIADLAKNKILSQKRKNVFYGYRQNKEQQKRKADAVNGNFGFRI